MSPGKSDRAQGETQILNFERTYIQKIGCELENDIYLQKLQFAEAGVTF